MRKFLIIFGFIVFGFLPLRAEVSTFSVVDENKHSKKEDFYHTFEYLILPPGQQNGQVKKCQATRVTPKWFVTAAHCVRESCQDGCEIQLDLLGYSPSVLARFTHPSKKNRKNQKPIVFVHPNYSPNVFAKNDFALLHLDVNNAPKIHYLRPTPKQNYRQIIPAKQFNDFLEKNRGAKAALTHALHPKLPPILYFDEGNFVLDRKISVIAIFDGVRDVKPDPNPVYYLKALGFAHTKNFGVRQGMSGSGVMTNTGELIGMVAGNFETWQQQGNNIQKGEDYFMFPVFNKGLMDFMKNTMGSDFDKITIKEAYPYCVSKTGKDFSRLIKMVNSADKNPQEKATVPARKKTGK